MFCKKCGQKIEENSKFCIICGVKVSDTDESDIGTLKENTPSELRGLGGWLILVAIGLFVSLFRLINTVYYNVSLFADGTVDSASSVIPGIGGAMGFEIIGNSILFGFIVYLLYLFFKKKVQFPKYFIYLLVVNTIFLFLDYFIMSSLSVYGDAGQKDMAIILSEQVPAMFGTVISAVIWILYMKKSKRVKATFIEI